METICHEMVHVKQFARGEMKDIMSSASKVRWKGSDYTREATD